MLPEHTFNIVDTAVAICRKTYRQLIFLTEVIIMIYSKQLCSRVQIVLDAIDEVKERAS
jgi:hypothetical protein